jgi:hypothetical protein
MLRELLIIHEKLLFLEWKTSNRGNNTKQGILTILPRSMVSKQVDVWVGMLLV